MEKSGLEPADQVRLVFNNGLVLEFDLLQLMFHFFQVGDIFDQTIDAGQFVLFPVRLCNDPHVMQVSCFINHPELFRNGFVQEGILEHQADFIPFIGRGKPVKVFAGQLSGVISQNMMDDRAYIGQSYPLYLS